MAGFIKEAGTRNEIYVALISRALFLLKSVGIRSFIGLPGILLIQSPEQIQPEHAALKVRADKRLLMNCFVERLEFSHCKRLI